MADVQYESMLMATQAIARVLLVEDEPKLRRSLAEGLCLEQWEVTSAATGEEAQRLLDRDAFDVVVLDWMLPDRDGLEIVRRLRAQGNRVPVLVISARGGSGITTLVQQAGATAYLAKPFSFEDLLERTRALLNPAA